MRLALELVDLVKQTALPRVVGGIIQSAEGYE